MLCTCKKGSVQCQKLRPCLGNYRPDRKRRSIRCIEEECCDLVQDVFLNNVDGGSKLVTSYRTLEENTSEISNQIRTSTIRYVNCPNELIRNSHHSSNGQTSKNSSNSPRSTINTRSVTTHPNLDRQSDGLCTLSNSLNPETNKHRQYITTFDGMRMRLRNRDHCHFVFARDCINEQFTIHLLYSSNHLKSNLAANRPFQDRTFNLTTINMLDGKSTSNYTQRYLSTLKEARSSNSERLNLFIRIGKRKIRLDHNLNVKLDNHPILLPYVHRGIKIIYHLNHVIIKSDTGLGIIWSGQEIVASLPKHYQQHTCGLCGNFNEDLTDDLKNRKGQLLQSQLRFFQSWTTGKKCLVSKQHFKSPHSSADKFKTKDEDNLISNNKISNSSTCKWSFRKKMKATKFCNSLKINLPNECVKNDEFKNYYE